MPTVGSMTASEPRALPRVQAIRQSGARADVSGGAGIDYDEATGSDARGSFSSFSRLQEDLASFIETGTYATCFQNAASLGQANAVEQFIYHGDAPGEFTIDLDLSGHFTNTTNDPSPYAGNFAELYVIYQDIDDYSSVIYGKLEIWTVFDVLRVEQSDAATVLSDALTFTMDPGDTLSVYLGAWSIMYGEGGVADAFSTTTVGFSAGPTDDLVRSGEPISIPEPRFAALLLAVLGAFCVLPRRMR